MEKNYTDGELAICKDMETRLQRAMGHGVWAPMCRVIGNLAKNDCSFATVMGMIVMRSRKELFMQVALRGEANKRIHEVAAEDIWDIFVDEKNRASLTSNAHVAPPPPPPPPPQQQQQEPPASAPDGRPPKTTPPTGSDKAQIVEKALARMLRWAVYRHFTDRKRIAGVKEEVMLTVEERAKTLLSCLHVVGGSLDDVETLLGKTRLPLAPGYVFDADGKHTVACICGKKLIRNSLLHQQALCFHFSSMVHWYRIDKECAPDALQKAAAFLVNVGKNRLQHLISSPVADSSDKDEEGEEEEDEEEEAFVKRRRVTIKDDDEDEKN